MGDTVVFTVSVDAEGEPSQPRETQGLLVPTLRAVLVPLVRSRVALLCVGAVLVVPAVTAVLAAGTAGVASIGDHATTLSVITALVFTTGVILGTRSRSFTTIGHVYWRDRLDVALGQAIASWAATLGVAMAAAPVFVWTVLQAEFGEAQLLPTLAILAMQAGVAASIGVAVGHYRRGFRPMLAAVGVSVAFLAVPIAMYGASLPFVTEEERITEYTFEVGTRMDGEVSYPAYYCATTTVRELRTHTQRVWIPLAASPLITVLDAPDRTTDDLLAARSGTWEGLQRDLRTVRLEPDLVTGYCYQPTTLAAPSGVLEERVGRAAPLSGTGMAMQIAIALLALGATVSRRTRS